SICEVGPLARSVEDVAILLDVLTGRGGQPAPLELDSSPPPVLVPRRHVEAAEMDPEISRAFEEALGVLRALGLPVDEVEIDGLADAAAADFLVLNAEA